ncbi:MAG TPA: ABC transporter ATP-binding protein, partial [Desulfurivibrionaceae bacterium]|nr:ABC transporter ATP-binding protein [Desulfurivibrionaceae bacterium]
MIWPLVRRYRWRLTVGLIALIGVDLLQLLVPRIIKRAVDGLTAGTATSALLAKLAGAVVGLALCIALCRFVWRTLILGFSRLVERDLREWLFGHLLTLDRIFFGRHPVGATMALATNDLAAVQLAAGMGVVAAVDAVVMTIAAFGFMLYIHPLLALLTLAPMPVLALITRVLSARVHQRFHKVQEQFSRLTEFARSTFSFIQLYKAFTQEEAQAARFQKLGAEYVRDNLRLATVQGVLFPSSGLVGNLSLLIVVVYGGGLTVRGVISTGDFVAFISYLLMLTWPMMALGWVFNLFQRGVISLERINEVLLARPSLPEITTSAPAHLAPVVTLRDLSFTYPGQAAPALQAVSVEFGQGITGIVGRTGAGKSTLCQLIARLYPVADGMLLVDGHDVNALDVSAVRGQIAYVPQETTIFSDTIARNIALGRPEASQEEIERVARAAAIHAEILAMPEGYQSTVGEKGVKLSGGQRQRLALARALLPDRPILLIDDGLAAVDLETEQRIVLALKEHLAGRTCLIVSHRLAPLQYADRILVFDGGRLMAAGSHGELLAQNPFYAAIHA